MNPDSNAIKLYNKMQNENIDYAVYESGVKVGAEKISPPTIRMVTLMRHHLKMMLPQ
jgi:hypothetical protein